MAASRAAHACEKAAYARTHRLGLDYGYVYTAWSDRRRTCGRCWEVKRAPGCGGCECSVPAPPPPPYAAPPSQPVPPVSQPESVPPAEPQPLPSARAAYYHPSSFTTEQRLDAHTASMTPGEAAHHRTLAPTAVQGADGSVIMEAFDPEGEMPYYYFAGEAGRPDYGVVRASHGDRSIVDASHLWAKPSK